MKIFLSFYFYFVFSSLFEDFNYRASVVSDSIKKSVNEKYSNYQKCFKVCKTKFINKFEEYNKKLNEYIKILKTKFNDLDFIKKQKIIKKKENTKNKEEKEEKKIEKVIREDL